MRTDSMVVIYSDVNKLWISHKKGLFNQVNNHQRFKRKALREGVSTQFSHISVSTFRHLLIATSQILSFQSFTNPRL